MNNFDRIRNLSATEINQLNQTTTVLMLNNIPYLNGQQKQICKWQISLLNTRLQTLQHQKNIERRIKQMKIYDDKSIKSSQITKKLKNMN